MRGRLLVGVMLLAGIAGGAMALIPLNPEASADEVLSNGGFEDWAGDTPSGWSILNGTSHRADTRAVSGSALFVDGATEAIVRQIVTVGAGSALTVAVNASADAPTDVTVTVFALDDGFTAKGAQTSITRTIAAGESFTPVTETIDLMPSWTAYAQITISARLAGPGPVAVYLDSASASEIAAAATATPTLSPTAEATPTTDGSEPTTTQTASTPKPGPTSTPTRAATTPPTPTPTRKATAARTPTPTPRPQQTPTPTNPDAAMTGLVLNGDFEALDNGKPAYWAKYGGEMGATGAAYGGKWAATLSSTTSSTKWLNQVVQVQSGKWYNLTANARAENATAFLRVSWYSSTDGGGSQLDSTDGSATAAPEWATLETGAVEAPAEARSARVKLMLRPESGSSRVLFDDVWLVETDAPPATPSPTTGNRTPPERGTTAQTPGHTSSRTDSSDGTSKPATPRAGTSKPRGTSAPLSLAGAHAAVSPLRLSEFMSDPPQSGNDGPDEWVELVNTSSAVVSTAGWHISDAKSADDIPAIDVPPGQYLVIAGKSASVDSDATVVRVADGVIGNGLSNGGDVITLVMPSGESADSISYGSNTDVFEPPPPAPDAGMSLGNRDPHADEASENWAPTLKPSPGRPNTFEVTAVKPTPRGTAPADAAKDATADSEARLLTPQSAHDSPGLSTLDWALIAGMLSSVSLMAGVVGRRYFDTVWKRIRRGH